MDKTCHLTELAPCYSHSTYGAKTTRGGGLHNNGPGHGHGAGFIYDDYARELPIVVRPGDWQARSLGRPETFKSPRHITLCLAVVLFVLQLGASLADVPATQLLEDMLCQSQSNESQQCRGVDVQAELNVLSVGALVFGYLPVILVAVPYGILSDRFGRKAVLALSVLGMVLSQLLWAVVAWNGQRWDLRYTWTSRAALLVGGGESVAQGMVFAMIADVAPQDKRATYFNLEMCAILLAQAAAPFIAAPMMTYSPWLPLLTAPGILTLGGFLIPCVIPDTLGMRRYYNYHYHEHREASSSSSSSKTKSGGGPAPLGSPRRPLPQQTHAPSSSANFDPWATPWSRARAAARAAARLCRARNLQLLLPCASLVVPIVTVTMDMVLRYVPARFGWTLAQAGMLLGARTGLTILVLLLILAAGCSIPPRLLSRASRLRTIMGRTSNKEKRDLVLARVSVVFLVAGLTTLAAAANIIAVVVGLAVMTLGSAAPALARASLVRLVAAPREEERRYAAAIGQLVGLLALCEAVGFLVCSVGLGALYQWCVHFAHPGADEASASSALAFPLYAATAIVFACGWLLGFVDVPFLRRPEEEEAANSADQEEGRAVSRSVPPPPRLPAAEEDEENQSMHVARVLADVRIVRKGPCLETVCLAA